QCSTSTRRRRSYSGSTRRSRSWRWRYAEAWIMTTETAARCERRRPARVRARRAKKVRAEAGGREALLRSPASPPHRHDGGLAARADDVHARCQARHVRLGDAAEADAEDFPPEHVVDDGLACAWSFDVEHARSRVRTHFQPNAT